MLSPHSLQGSNYTTKYVFEEADGTVRDGQGANPRPRFLTPRECARVMGFPDTFVIPGVDTALDTPAGNGSPAKTSKSSKQDARRAEQARGNWYKQIGNAVCPPVIRAVGGKVLAALSQAERFKAT